MKKHKNKLLSFAVGIFILAGYQCEVFCSSQLPAGAKYLALGGMTATSVNDVYALGYNPAQLTAVDSLEFAAEYTSMFTGMDNAPARKFIAAALPLQQTGAIGVYGNLFDAGGALS